MNVMEAVKEETVTDGVFFHGSPAVNVQQFSCENSRLELNARFGKKDSVATGAIFFTEFPTDAAGYAARRAQHHGGMGGRVYSVNLITRNPYVSSPQEWHGAVRVGDGFNRSFEADMMKALKDSGYDSVIPYHAEGRIHEIAIFYDWMVRPVDGSTKRLVPWDSPRRYEPLTFFRDAARSGPNYAPECVLLSAEAAPDERAAGRVVIGAECPIYCPEHLWSNFDFAELRDFGVDCLVDPATGDALVLEPENIKPMCRAQIRGLRRRLNRLPA